MAVLNKRSAKHPEICHIHLRISPCWFKTWQGAHFLSFYHQNLPPKGKKKSWAFTFSDTILNLSLWVWGMSNLCDRKQCRDAKMGIHWFTFPMNCNELLSNDSMNYKYGICPWISFILIPALHDLSQKILSHAKLGFWRVESHQGIWGKKNQISAHKMLTEQELVKTFSQLLWTP